MNYSNFLCMAICVCFSDLHFFTTNITFKSTWEINQLIDHCIHAHEFRDLPQNCCVKIAWTLTVYFWRSIHFFLTKNSDN